MATASNGSFASPLADAKYAPIIGNPQLDGLLGRLGELSGWQIALTLLLVLVAYDQCKLFACHAPHQTQAESSTGSYIWQKGSIAGPAWKAPFIGPFLQSMNPKFEEYMAKWASGDLSCVSVFHK